MKLAVLAFATTLGLAGAAHAEPARPGPARPNAELKQALLDRFDRNHDGRLEPDERRRAIRALHRIARRMAVENRRELHGARVTPEQRQQLLEQRRERQIERQNERRQPQINQPQ